MWANRAEVPLEIVPRIELGVVVMPRRRGVRWRGLGTLLPKYCRRLLARGRKYTQKMFGHATLAVFLVKCERRISRQLLQWRESTQYYCLSQNVNEFLFA